MAGLLWIQETKPWNKCTAAKGIENLSKYMCFFAFREAFLLSSSYDLFQVQRLGIGVKTSFVIADYQWGWAKARKWVLSEHLVCSQAYAKSCEGVLRSNNQGFFSRKVFN